jgi:hypothetical protein
MNHSKEPVAIINGCVTLVEALIAITVGFGLVNLTVEQVGLLMAFVIAVGNLVKTLWARGQVTPVNNPRDNEGHNLQPA